ncbi:MAG: hypothetical protein WAM97_17705 [Acidimicrobiales bacterium]
MPNPAPEVGVGAGIPEHIAVSTKSLKPYPGTHTVTSNKSIVFGQTGSGDTLVGEKSDVVLAETG